VQQAIDVVKQMEGAHYNSGGSLHEMDSSNNVNKLNILLEVEEKEEDLFEEAKHADRPSHSAHTNNLYKHTNNHTTIPYSTVSSDAPLVVVISDQESSPWIGSLSSPSHDLSDEPDGDDDSSGAEDDDISLSMDSDLMNQYLQEDEEEEGYDSASDSNSI
jgi:hypothetical protein